MKPATARRLAVGLGLGICMLALALERTGTGPHWGALIGGIALATPALPRLEVQR